MRCALLAIALAGLAACHHGKASGPAWPAASTTAEDGGESIAPKPTASYAAVIESSKDDGDAKPATAAATPAGDGSASDDKPATTPASAPATVEDVFQGEDIIIEIDE